MQFTLCSKKTWNQILRSVYAEIQVKGSHTFSVTVQNFFKHCSFKLQFWELKVCRTNLHIILCFCMQKFVLFTTTDSRPNRALVDWWHMHYNCWVFFFIFLFFIKNSSITCSALTNAYTHAEHNMIHLMLYLVLSV